VARGCDVIGIDPSEEMLARAREADMGARYAKGEAAATGLEATSIDLVTVGQAFHWFEFAQVLPEFRRILTKNGWCAAFWNLRAPTPLLAEYEQVLNRHASEYADRPHGERTLAALRSDPRVRDVHETEIPNVQRLDLEGLLGRAHSSSYVVQSVADRPAFDAELGALFARHASGGEVEFLYRTVVILFRL
jgi:SAM-dependent methyltransferase